MSRHNHPWSFAAFSLGLGFTIATVVWFATGKDIVLVMAAAVCANTWFATQWILDAIERLGQSK